MVMTHFFRQYLMYVTFEVLEPLWRALQAKVQTAQSLDEVSTLQQGTPGWEAGRRALEDGSHHFTSYTWGSGQGWCGPWERVGCMLQGLLADA